MSSRDPMLVVDGKTGCFHVPVRFEQRYRESVDLTAGPAVEKALEAVDALVNLGVTAVLLSGRPGCGKSLLAAVACNEGAAPLHREYAVALAERERVVKAYNRLTRDPIELPTFDELDAVSRRHRLAERFLRDECPRWVSVPAFLGGLRREIGRPERPAAAALDELLSNPGLLVLDDLGAEKASDWTIETLFELVASRYDRGGRLLITTNRSAAELMAMGYERVVSRMSDDGLLVQMTSAKDYRQKLRRSLAS